MIAIKNSKRASVIALAAFITALIVFIIFYINTNFTGERLIIDDVAVKYGEAFTSDGMEIIVDRPEVKKLYDDEYEEYVYRYYICFEVLNNSKEKNRFPVDQLQILSAGRVWYGWPYDSYDTDQKTIWGELKPGEKTKGLWIIDAVVEHDIAEKNYEQYSLYYMNDAGDEIHRYTFG